MIKRNKLKIIISSVAVLIPILFGWIFWNNLPDTFTTHWGIDGVADGVSGKAFAVFGIPAILLVIHFICLAATLFDKKQKEQNEKVLGMVFWIMPMISLLANGIVYSAALGKEIGLTFIIPAFLGVMLIFMGNYLPKTKQNITFGIKTLWALRNEENWNKTHRFGGKIWVIGGFILLISSFLPFDITFILIISVILLIVIAPFVYSYNVYKKHKEAGIKYEKGSKTKGEKIAKTVSMILVTVILIGIAIIMFTGDIEVVLGDDSMKISATYSANSEIKYSDIEKVEYREDFDTGIRTSGFYSARLSLGIYKNDEFGSYTLYSYNSAEDFVILTSGEKTLVIGLENDTKAVYDKVLEEIGQ